jgi:hypothetical protein
MSNNVPEQQYPEGFRRYFKGAVEDYLDSYEVLSEQLQSLEEFLWDNEKNFLNNSELQEELKNFEDALLEFLSQVLGDLNYFLYMEHELPNILNALNGSLTCLGSDIKDFHEPETLKKEKDTLIKNVFAALAKIRMHYNEETIADLQNGLETSDIFAAEITGHNFLEASHMADKMEVDFWISHQRRLNLHKTSEETAQWLDEQEKDPENRKDRIQAIIEGAESTKFPLSMVNFDSFSDEEIINAEQSLVLQWEEEDKAEEIAPPAILPQGHAAFDNWPKPAINTKLATDTTLPAPSNDLSL